MVPYVALFAWPLVSLVFFQRFAAPIAVLLTILVGYLLLPEKTYVNLPVIPTLDKNTIPALAALFLAMVLTLKIPQMFPSLSGWVPRSWWLRLLILLAIFGTFMTMYTNRDTVVYGATVLRGLSLYDAFSNILLILMSFLPVMLARKFLCSPKAHQAMLAAFCVGGLVYSFFILVELRMSPQLHYWVYGYFPHVWVQHIRSGGWRPLVFLSHGLLVGMFMCFAVLSAVAMIKIDKARRGLYLMAAIWLFLALLISKNLGSLLIAMILTPVILLLGRRLQMLAILVVASLFILYPGFRSSDYFPKAELLSFASDISPARADSLDYRFYHEDNMLAKFQERPAFGWGWWARNRVYDEKGNDITVTDGAWIIIVGTSGWVGYVAQFGIIVMPLFLLWYYRRRYDVGPETIALAIILSANLVDLMPNASMTPLTFLLAGALWGRLELGRVGAPETDSVDTEPARGRPLQAGPVTARAATDETVTQQSGTPVYTRQANRIEHRRQNRR